MAIDPVTAQLIIGAGSGLLQGLNNNQQAAMTGQQLEEQKRQFDRQMGQTQGQQALVASQMDPLSQQRSRQLSALVGQILQGYKPTQLEGNTFTGGLRMDPALLKNIMSYFSPEANASAERAFTANAGMASGGRYTAPDLASVGYGQAGAPVTPTTPMPSAGTAVPRDPYTDSRTDARRRRGGMEF